MTQGRPLSKQGLPCVCILFRREREKKKPDVFNRMLFSAGRQLKLYRLRRDIRVVAAEDTGTARVLFFFCKPAQ